MKLQKSKSLLTTILTSIIIISIFIGIFLIVLHIQNKHYVKIINAKIITIPVRYNVAKFELTFLIPILARIVVMDVKNAASKAKIIHIIPPIINN